ncbi:AAA family ATPase [Ramlibacter sp. MMS24-I3-19]|uniref:AAA family ATPase n=1 Tax=Ramlibacter sp. MMS24-I3-19 TaxID=3416606 RepID=UPI003CFE2DA8
MTSSKSPPAAAARIGADRGGTPYCDRTADDPRHTQLARRLLYDQVDFEAQVTWAKSLSKDAGAGVLTELERAQQLGPLRYLCAGGSFDDLEQLRMDFPTFSKVIDFVWSRVMLARLVHPPAVRIPPILLNGPAGTGKTAFSKRLADWLNVPIVEVDVSMLETSFRLTGLDAGYATGKPGRVWEALQCESMSPVIVLDEIDKRPDSTRDSGLSFLLGLLEPTSAVRFQDAYVGLPIDASQIAWIATCNELGSIEAPLRSRFRIFNIEAPSREQMAAVIQSVFRSLRHQESWGRVFPEVLPSEVIARLFNDSPRSVWQSLEDACAKAAAAGRRYLVAQDVTPNRPKASRNIGFLATNSLIADSNRKLP